MIDLNLLIKIQVVGIYYSFCMVVFNDKMITISNLLNAWLILNTKAGLERQKGEQSEVVERNNKRVKTMRDTPPHCQKCPGVCVTAMVGRSHKECVS